MPLRRSSVFESDSICWELVTFTHGAQQWTPHYVTAAPKLVVPHWGSVQCERVDRLCAANAISPLRLDVNTRYRVRHSHHDQVCDVLTFTLSPSWGDGTLSPLALLSLSSLRSRLAEYAIDRERVENLLLSMAGASPCMPHRVTDRMQRAVEFAKSIVAADPGGRLPLAQLARDVHCSPFHLTRAFRTLTGVTLGAYRTQLRVAMALRRLQQDGTNLSALAYELGFSNHSHLSSAVRKHLRATPSQLRKILVAADPATFETR